MTLQEEYNTLSAKSNRIVTITTCLVLGAGIQFWWNRYWSGYYNDNLFVLISSLCCAIILLSSLLASKMACDKTLACGDKLLIFLLGKIKEMEDAIGEVDETQP